ncbi:MAG: helix-turn-helix transcriptional regulator [Methylomicrobium sp.]
MSPQAQFIRLSAVIQITSISRSGVYARLNPRSPSYDPTFPRPIKLSSGPRGAVAWVLSEIQAWVRSKIAERNR